VKELRHLKSQAGLTLVELMVAVVILALGLWGVSSMFIYGYTSQINAQYTQIATHRAQELSEEMRAAGVNHITTENFPSPIVITDLPNGVATRSWTAYPDASVADQLLLTVTVRWEQGPRMSGHVSMQTVVARRP